MPPASESSAPPRQRRSADERRLQIVRATIEVVTTHGYANATLTAIAGTANVAKGLLWHYFDDRDDLMRHAVDHLAGVVRDAVVDGLDLSAPVPEVIRGVFVNTARLTRTHGAELETLDQIVHNLRTPDGRQLMSMRDYEVVYAEHERLLGRGQRDGSLRAGDLRVMAVGYQGVVDAMIGYLQAHPDEDPDEHADAMCTLFLAGAAGVGSSSAGRTASGPTAR